MPSFEEIENPRSSLATEVYSSDGVLLGKYYFQNRSTSSFDEIPEMIRNCLIATEDIRFYDHSGIDYWGQFAAFIQTMIGDKRGASTITQQLAKNLFPRPVNANVFTTILSKFKEWVIAIKLERRYTKDEILNLYLHCGVTFSWLEKFLSRIGLNSSAWHNVHHCDVNANFGEVSFIWDKICKTTKEDFAKKKAAKA